MVALDIKEKVLESLEGLSKSYIHEVFDFIEFLKLHEDKWFIDYINKLTQEALLAKKKKKKFYGLQELRREFYKK